MSNFDQLWSPVQIGSIELGNRVALAPMTRVSATEDGRATERMAAYYRAFARGGFGLLITEGIYPDTAYSQGYLFQPGLATKEQASSWVKVVEAVHSEGAKIIAQLMHAGAQTQGNRFMTDTVGPSAIAPKGEQLGFYRGEGPYAVPAEITRRQMDEVRDGFVAAALRAKEAGFDGVEIHGANGYLLDQFLTDYLNERTDDYGGTAENRVRFAAEISSAVREAVGPDMTVGIRISQAKVSDNEHRWAGGADEAKIIFSSPGCQRVSTSSTPRSTRPLNRHSADSPESLAMLAREHSGATVIANGMLDDPETAAALLAGGAADVVALGKAAFANRDWPHKVRNGVPFAELDGSLFAPVADVKDWELEMPA